MKMKPFLPITAALLALAPVQVLAQDTEALLREFRGEAPAQTRDAARWQSDFTAVLNALLPDMSSDDLDKRGNAQTAWEKVVLRASRPNAEAERASVARAMIAKLGADTPTEARLWMLKMLEWSGRAEAVAPIAALLNDTNPQIAERARRALANNQTPEANAALRAALQNSTPANRAALINALGFRKEAGNVATLGKYLQDGDAGVVAQTVAALGDAGTPEALNLLSAFQTKASATVKPLVTDALLENAERAVRERRAKDAAPIYAALYVPASSANLRAAALRGLVLSRGIGALPQLSQALSGDDASMRAHAARLTLLIPGADGTKALSGLLPKLSPAAQISLIDALGERADASAKTALVALNASANDDVRAAVVRAMGRLGGANDVVNLLTIAASDKAEANAARDALGRIGNAQKDGAQVEARLVQSVTSTDAKVGVEAIKALSARRSNSATSTLLAALNSPAPVSVEAARALGEIGSSNEVPALVSWIQKGGDAGVAEKSVSNIFVRSDRSKISAAPLLQVLDTPNVAAPARTSAFRLLGVLGTADGFERVRVATNDANPEVREAAIRAMADWPSEAAIPTLLEIAKSENKPVLQVLALRGVARLVGKSNQNADAKIAILRDGMSAAKRGEEKQLMLGALGEIKTLPALQLAGGLLDDAGLKEVAAATMLKIAKDLRDQPLRDAKPLLEQAQNTTPNADTKRELGDQIRRAG